MNSTPPQLPGSAPPDTLSKTDETWLLTEEDIGSVFPFNKIFNPDQDGCWFETPVQREYLKFLMAMIFSCRSNKTKEDISPESGLGK